MSHKTVSIFGISPDYPPGLEDMKWAGKMIQEQEDGMHKSGFLSERFIKAIYGPEQVATGALEITSCDISFKTSVEGFNTLVAQGLLSEDFRSAFNRANDAVDKKDSNRTWLTKLREAYRERNHWNYPHTVEDVPVTGFNGAVTLRVARHGLD